MPCKEWREERLQKCAQENDEGYSKCSESADRGYSKCTESRDAGYSACSEQRDQGYSSCSQTKDNGYSSCAEWKKNCCTWWPCSWACEAFSWVCVAWVWIANVVCVAWTWISNVVCVAWTWISNVVCVAWTWISNVVCVAWTWISNVVCVLWTEIVNAYCAVWEAISGRSPFDTTTRRRVSLADLPAFPDDFLWGAATAGYQVEGAIENNDWHLFTTSPGIHDRVARLSGAAGTPMDLKPAREAVRHHDEDTLKDDLDRARLLGMNAYRFSIEWSRVQPRKPTEEDEGWDEAGLEYYRRALKAMAERGLTPVPTLNHLTLPDWVLTPPFSGVVGGNHDDADFQASLRGWETNETVNAFVDFVKKVVRAFRDEVTLWVTFNEPVGSLVGVGYLGGVWPPGFLLRGDLAKTAYFNVLKAHVRAYDAIKQIYAEGDDDRECEVGIVQSMIYAKVAETNVGASGGDGAKAGAALGALGGAIGGGIAAGPIGAVVGLAAGAISGAFLGGVIGFVGGAIVGIQGQHEAARNQFDYFYNWHLFDSLLTGTVDTEIHRRPQNRVNVPAREFYELEEETFVPRLDFIGINYYRGVYVYYYLPIATRASYTGGAFDQDYRKSQQPHGLVNDMGWEVSPEGFYFILTEATSRYTRGDGTPYPILVTENGLPEDADRNRAPYIVAHLEHLLAARRDGADIRAYLCWSLVDNFEWAFNYEPTSKFGLFRIDDRAPESRDHSQSTNLDRHVTEAALALQFLIAETAPRREGGRIAGVGKSADKFGTIQSDGMGVVAPTLSPAALFDGRFLAREAAAGQGRFTVYLNPLSPVMVGESERPRWVGMIFIHDARLWARLEGIEVLGAGEEVSVSFRHRQVPEGRPARVPARMYAGAASAGRLTGTAVEDDGTERAWEARKIAGYGSWKRTTPDLPEIVTIADLEGPAPFGGWTGKFLGVTPEGLPFWWTIKPALVDSANSVMFVYGADGVFEGALAGTTMTGTLRYTSGNQGPVTWAAEKLPDEVPL
jgi:beta-glucosidase/6-phospho-beta-glucosidase/beta-galactosidase